jgi:hypothetical protein
MITTVIQTGRRSHAKVLISLIMERKLEKIAEIGVLRGRCTRTILRSPAIDIIKDYIAIDQWKVWDTQNAAPWVWAYPQEYWDSYYKGVVKYMQWFPQLRIIKLSSLETAPLFKDGYFDLVFIDGDHSYNGVISDIKAWMPKVRDGGILCGHDYRGLENMGETISCQDVISAVDDFFGDKKYILSGTVWAVEVPVL